MILRNLASRQSRQLFGLSRQTRILSRFNSTRAGAGAPIDIAEPVSVEKPVVENGTPSEPSEWPGQFRPKDAWMAKEQSKHRFHAFGSDVTDAYQPEQILRNPPKPSDITLELLLASQTHLGHSTSRWNPQNSRYIFGIRDGIHIISLDVTAAYLRRAATVVEEVAARGGLVLFVGTRKGQKRIVYNAAQLSKGYHIFERWIPGSLTNGQQILGHCEKKVVNGLDEELPEFKEKMEDSPSIKPDLVVCLNPLENVVMLHECGLNNVPTIGIIDTDADATRVTYPIPANDDSLRSVGVIAGILARAGQAGQARRLEQARLGKLTYRGVTKAELGGQEEQNRQA